MEKNTKIEVKSAFSVQENELIEFYNIAFNNRIKYLTNYWKWLNRCDFFNKKTPLIVEKDNKVIAHAGMTPFNLSLNGKEHTAAWFIDFKILDEYQRQGLGGLLTNEWIKYPDCCVTFCNHKSIGVFKKIGWQESFETYRLINFIYLFNHPGFIRKLPLIIRKTLNFIVRPFLFLLYKIKAHAKQNYSIEKLSKNSLSDFYNLYKNQYNKNKSSTIRDEEYVKWRIADSPNREHYYIYSTDNFKAILLIHNNHSTYIDILWVSNNSDKLQLKRMIARLGLYGFENNIAYIRFLTMQKDIANDLKKALLSKIQYLRFAYFSKNNEIFDEMKKTQFDFELIDSDFEHIK